MLQSMHKVGRMGGKIFPQQRNKSAHIRSDDLFLKFVFYGKEIKVDVEKSDFSRIPTFAASKERQE